MNKTIPEVRFKGFTDDWEQRKLGDITESFSGGTPTAGKSEYYGGDIPFIRSGEISSELTELFITENGLNNSSAKMVKVGDILYALYGATSGEVSISRINGAINQAILAIRPTKNDNSYLIVQWLRKQKDTIISTYLQGGQGNLSSSIVKDLVITLPQDKEEQSKIGAFFKQLDDTIALHQRQLENYQKLKKAMLQEIFPEKGSEIPKIRFGGFTEKWEQRKLGEEFVFFSGLTYSPSNIRESGSLVLRSSNVQNGEIVDADNVYVENSVVNSKNVEVGDIAVVVRNGSRSLIGKHAQIKKEMPNTVIGAFMTGITYKVPKFANALLGTQTFEKEIAKNLGATINQITTGMFKQMIFDFPNEKIEQVKIGEFFNTLDNTIALHQKKAEELKRAKKYFLKKMFI
ncbi:restriction endonuclease subunit S [Pisciglobus halotolerans]|uniref:Type I restriction enzyme, S subunit n=1 Tax=Pisciglobus halotolerans TaxID=745365 RepID=A0A1I3B4K4_9LACT|nr:restriction endonuclease subunit S [Pisciglobus halotolerans]SFH56889.1 type I restriction enzyme, S subunit [Pisciglobus halotolerans]